MGVSRNEFLEEIPCGTLELPEECQKESLAEPWMKLFKEPQKKLPEVSQKYLPDESQEEFQELLEKSLSKFLKKPPRLYQDPTIRAVACG